MDNGTARIDALTARLSLLERRTADEAASIRAELHDLQGAPLEPPVMMPPWPPARPARPAREPRDLSWLLGRAGLQSPGVWSP